MRRDGRSGDGSGLVDGMLTPFFDGGRESGGDAGSLVDDVADRPQCGENRRHSCLPKDGATHSDRVDLYVWTRCGRAIHEVTLQPLPQET